MGVICLQPSDSSWLAYYGFAHFRMRNLGEAQLLSRSHLVEHTSIPVILQVSLISQRSSSGDKTWHFLVHHFLLLLNLINPKGHSRQH
jgi:hypothetical protein